MSWRDGEDGEVEGDGEDREVEGARGEICLVPPFLVHDARREASPLGKLVL